MYKQYLGLIRDHSASMGHLGLDALKDYNDGLHTLKIESSRNNIQTIASVIKCGSGRGGAVEREVVNQPIEFLNSISKYPTDGSCTPLFDSIGQMIELFEAQDRYDGVNPTTSFLVIATTDGENNRNYIWNSSNLAKKIRELQATDRWTFAFRVPYGYKESLVKLLGVHPGNVIEWEQTSSGVEESTRGTMQSYGNYYSSRSRGITASQSFFVDPSTITTKELKTTLVDISSKISSFDVWPKDNGKAIKTFVEDVTGKPYILGNSYYELSKTETLQPQKGIIVWDIKNGKMYEGQSSARELLNLPQTGNIKVIPRGNNNKRVFIQSTSVNRKLVGDTILLIFNK